MKNCLKKKIRQNKNYIKSRRVFFMKAKNLQKKLFTPNGPLALYIKS